MELRNIVDDAAIKDVTVFLVVLYCFSSSWFFFTLTLNKILISYNKETIRSQKNRTTRVIQIKQFFGMHIKV